MPEHKRWGISQKGAPFIKGDVRTGHLALFGLYRLIESQVGNTNAGTAVHRSALKFHRRQGTIIPIMKREEYICDAS